MGKGYDRYAVREGSRATVGVSMLMMRAQQRRLLDDECGRVSCSENWVGLEYRFADSDPVAGASYLVADASSGFKQKGTLDDSGRALIMLPKPTLKVTITLYDDPEVVKLLVKPEAHSEKVEPGWFEAIVKGLRDAGVAVWGVAKAVFSWIWGVIQGDFNEEATVGQIIVGTIVTMIPVVDQLGDLRDLAASLKQLIWDKRYGEVMVWVGLVLTLVGTFPELGSLAKGIFKAILRGTKVSELLKRFNYFAKGNGFKWLKKLKDNLPAYVSWVTKKGDELLAAIRTKLDTLLSVVPASFSRVRMKLDEVLETLKTVQSQLASRVRAAFDDIKQKLDDALKRFQKESKTGGTRQTHVQQQGVISRHAIEPSGAVGSKPRGSPTALEGSTRTKNSLRKENESAEQLAARGFDVEQNPTLPGGKKPDYLIEGQVFDCYTPHEADVDGVRKSISGKVRGKQADRIVVNLDLSPLTPADIEGVLTRKPVTDLKEVIILKDGEMNQLTF